MTSPLLPSVMVQVLSVKGGAGELPASIPARQSAAIAAARCARGGTW